MKNTHTVFMFLLIAAACLSAQLFSPMRHFVNTDSNHTDRIVINYEGSADGNTEAQVRMTARGGTVGRSGLNITLVSDFSGSMRESAADTAAQKVKLMGSAVRLFIDSFLQDDDELAMMRYQFDCQFIPEREYPKNYGTYAPNDTTYCDTFYYIPGYLRGNVDSLFIRTDYYGVNMYTMLIKGAPGNVYLSYGIESLWWTFCHQVWVAAFSGYTPSPTLDTAGTYRILVSAEQGWWNNGSSVHPIDPRTGGLIDPDFNPATSNNIYIEDGTSTYYTLWQSIRYARAHSTKAAQPVIILLCDGADNYSAKRFRHLDDFSTYPIPRPSFFQKDSLKSDDSLNLMRIQFVRFMDSIKNNTPGVKLHIVVLDTTSKPDFTVLRNVALATGGSFNRAKGRDLDSIYSMIGDAIHTQVARTVNVSTPIFKEELSPAIHLVPNSLEPLASNTVSFDSIVTSSVAGKTIISFYMSSINGMWASDVFDYRYRFTAALSAPAVDNTPIIINPTDIDSRAIYLTAENLADTLYFPEDTIWVRSKVNGLEISSNSASFDTTGTNYRHINYDLSTSTYDTATTFYAFLSLTATTGTNYFPINTSTWSFNPINWIQYDSRSISDVSAQSVRPFAIITQTANSHTEEYPLVATYTIPQTGQKVRDTVRYDAIPGSTNDWIDNIVFSNSRSQRTDIPTIQGDIQYLATYSGLRLYALGHWRIANTYTLIEADSWAATEGFSRYTQIPTQMATLRADSSRILMLKPDPDVGSSANQSDSGTININYTNILGTLLSQTQRIRILDTTPMNIPNAIAIFPSDVYEANMTDSAALADLYFYYDTLSRYTLAPNDTINLTLYALVFSVNNGAATYIGLDAQADWIVNSSIIGRSFSRTDNSQLTYNNTLAPRTDNISLSGATGTQTLTIVWSYGSERRLSLESQPGIINDNTGSLPEKTQIILDPTISADQAHAVVRDQFGNYIPFSGTITWSVPDAGYDANISITATGTPCVVTRLQVRNLTYKLYGVVPTGEVVGGITLSNPIKDSLTIIMTAIGFDGITIRVQSGEIRDTSGTVYTFSTDLPSDRVVELRANTDRPRFAAYSHKLGQSLSFPTEYEENQNVVWSVTNTAPFLTDPGKTGFVVELSPRYAVDLDTLIAEYDYGGTFFRDTVLFRVKPGYPSNILMTLPSTIVAGETEPFSIVLIDANGDTVTDPALFPQKILVWASDTTVAVDWGNGFEDGFDSVYYSEFPITFGQGISIDSIKSLLAGTSWVKVALITAIGETLYYADTFTVYPGAANNLSIVKQGSSIDLIADTLGLNASTGYYEALLFDSYGNRINDPAVLINITWSALGTLDTSSAAFRPNLYRLTYYAPSISASGRILANYSSTIKDSFHLSIFATARISRIITHEWIADTSITTGLTVNQILSDLGLSTAISLDNATKLDTLRNRGYFPYQDGYLDYLDITLSSEVYLSLSALNRISYALIDSQEIVWHGLFNKGAASASLYSIVPIDGKTNTSTDSTHSRYRLWLKPSFLIRNNFERRAFVECLETGFLPSIVINNNIVETQNPAGITFGSADTYTFGASVSVDSADPVISKALYYDNRCDNTANKLEIYFSEPVKSFPNVRSTLSNFRHILAFGVRKANPVGPERTDFMADHFIVDSAVCLTTKMYANKYETSNYIDGNTQQMVCYTLYLADTASAIELLSAAGNAIHLALPQQPADRQVYDVSASENCGNEAKNKWVPITTGITLNGAICDVAKITESKVTDAVNFTWTGNQPLFPYWGPTITNPYGDSDPTRPPEPIHIQVQIFDLLGNLVASPDKNPCLGVTIEPDVFQQTDGSYSKTYRLGYDLLIQSGSGSPCGIVPAWNALNNKGRMVAPGGYLVKVLVDNQVNKPESVDLKLIMGR